MIVRKSSNPHKWPFPDCDVAKIQNRGGAVVVIINGKEYALNGTAFHILGLPDAPIILGNSVRPYIKAALNE